MTALNVLEDVEDFLQKDLAGEVLSTRVETKRSKLLAKVSVCIAKIKEENKLEEFLAKQRDLSRTHISENNQKDSTQMLSDDEDDDDYYIDLTGISTSAVENKGLSPPVTDEYGSGSGYESYVSDEEASAKPKARKEEDLSAYFSSVECDVVTYIFTENKTFLKGKKWQKRIGIVKENHLKIYKKPSDSTAVLDVPLRGYNTTMRNKIGTSWIAVILSTVSDGEAYRFFVERDKIDEWSKILRDKTLSLTDEADLPPPPVAARPASSLPRLPMQTTNDRSKSLDVTILMSDTNAPPVPPGHPSMPQQASPNLSKGLKMAVTDIFKKDKTKKKIMTAENLGADVCGHLMVFDNKWVKKWCLISSNQLMIYGKEEAPELQIELQGCELLPYSEDKERQFGFKLTRGGKELVFMEASSSTEMGRWVATLLAETGCTKLPELRPDYMPVDIRKSVMNTAQQAFASRKESILKQSGRSTFFQDDLEEENIYLDLDTVSQAPKLNLSPKKIIPPPLPPSTGRTSRSQSSPTEISSANEKTGKNELKTPPPVGEEKADDSSSETKKAKAKQKKRKKNVRRHLTEPSIKQAADLRDIKVIREPLSEEDPEKDASETDGSKSLVDSIVEKRRKEFLSQKAEIKTKLLTLSVKKDELRKYIDAASTEKERARLQNMLRKATSDHSKLEKEDAFVDQELKKLEGRSFIDSPANQRPPRRPITTGASGNVMSKAQMWEANCRK